MHKKVFKNIIKVFKKFHFNKEKRLIGLYVDNAAIQLMTK